MIFFLLTYFHLRDITSFFKAHSVVAGGKICVSWRQLDVTEDLILHTEATLVFLHKCQPPLCLLLLLFIYFHNWSLQEFCFVLSQFRLKVLVLTMLRKHRWATRKNQHRRKQVGGLTPEGKQWGIDVFIMIIFHLSFCRDLIKALFQRRKNCSFKPLKMTHSIPFPQEEG